MPAASQGNLSSLSPEEAIQRVARAREALLTEVLENEPQNRSANFLLEMLLSEAERWDDLQRHHERRGLAAEEHERVELYRQFALEWVQRFRDRATERLAQAHASLAPTSRLLLEALPYLLHVNSPSLPGYAGSACPSGISDV